MHDTLRLQRALQIGLWVTGIFGISGAAEAANGTLHLTGDKTLTSDQYGAIIFDADNITLDCAWKHLRYSPTYSPVNCSPEGVGRRCGIIAVGHHNVTIQRCYVDGIFDFAVDVESTEQAAARDVVVTGSSVGFEFLSNTNASGYQLTANDTVRGVDVNYDQYGFFEHTVVASTLQWGIYVQYSTETTFDATSVSYSNAFGFVSRGNTGILVNGLDVSNSWGGFLLYNSIGALTDSYLRDNELEGLKVLDSWDSWLSGNHVEDNNVSGNAFCDAYQDGGGGNGWSGNTLESWCGSVPNSH
jgi:hypothetical protein